MATSGSGSETRTKHQPYWCFLVRCRLEEGAGPDGEHGWRFTVQQADPAAARHSFACLHDVAIHIEAELTAYGAFAQDRPNNGVPGQRQDASQARNP